MPILIILLVLAALVWGAVAAFRAVAAQLGMGIALGLSGVVVLLLILALAAWRRRRRDIAPNTKEGDWTHVVRTASGELKLSSIQGLLWLSRDGAESHYTLSDVGACEARYVDGQWCVAIDFRDTSRATWSLPMPDRRAARRWARVVTLARAGKL